MACLLVSCTGGRVCCHEDQEYIEKLLCSAISTYDQTIRALLILDLKRLSETVSVLQNHCFSPTKSLSIYFVTYFLKGRFKTSGGLKSFSLTVHIPNS